MKTPPRLPPRAKDSHKGDFGRVLIVAGSLRMPGAAALCALGALRGGAGLVEVALPESALTLVAPIAPCALFFPLPESQAGFLAATAGTRIEERAALADVVLIGPGLGQEGPTQRLLRRLVTRVAAPLVLDADGLNALAREPALLARRSNATVITPHPGELLRLDRGEMPKGGAARKARAAALAKRLRAVVCLKGHRTVVTDGERSYVNATGNPGMASGGTGDVLAGLLAALLARFTLLEKDPLEAAALAVHAHGLAGDLAAKRLGQTALIATDLIAELGPALCSLERGRG